MNSQHFIDNSQYPSDFMIPVTIPVTEELHRNCKLSGTLRNQLNPGTPFTFAMDQAIATAERHMFIFDPVAVAWLTNPVKMLNDWVNLVRWEVSTFWKVYRGSNNEIAHTDSTLVHYSHEHPKRAGEKEKGSDLLLTISCYYLRSERKKGLVLTVICFSS